MVLRGIFSRKIPLHVRDSIICTKYSFQFYDQHENLAAKAREISSLWDTVIAGDAKSVTIAVKTQLKANKKNEIR